MVVCFLAVEPTMEQAKRDVLAQFRARLEHEVPDAAALLTKLERTGLELTRAEPAGAGEAPAPASRPDARTSWLLYWEPPEHLRAGFDLAPELLIVLSPWLEAQAKDVAAAEATVAGDLRLDRGLVVFLARDASAARRLRQAAESTGRLYVFLTFREVGDAQDPQRWFRELLRERIGQADLFAAGRPVLGWDFVGREHELRELRGRLLDGRPVALYGLRKSGKTSALLALKRQLAAPAVEAGSVSTIIVHLDLLTMSFAEKKRSGFYRFLLRRLHRALQDQDLDPTVLGLPASFADRRRLESLDADDLERLVPEALECLIDWARNDPTRPLVALFLDEYERLLGATGFPVEDGLDILDYLRGLVQDDPHAFNFLIAGLDRSYAAVSRIQGRQNPLFNFVVDYTLSGLARADMNRLIRRIGGRLGLEFETDALDVIWQETGGHPYLARELARVIDAAVPPAERTPKAVGAPLVSAHLESFRRRPETTATMREILETIEGLERGAGDMLVYALREPAEAAAALGLLKAATVETLRRYGVLHDVEPRLRIGCFGAWLLEDYLAAPSLAAHG
jgi:hypothetical protein